MPVFIDRFSTLGGAVVIIGWSSDYKPGDKLSVVQEGKGIQTITVPVSRPDVAAQYGRNAINWGFRVYGISKTGNTKASGISLNFPSGFVIESVSLLNPHQYDQPHSLWESFVKEINSSGGTVLEIGSRDRSGNTARGHFSSNVKYLGLDVTAGRNVDLVGDAHHLSELLGNKIDYIFSISTFEHFIMPWKVVLEINKVLKVGGKVFSHSHQTWPSHDEPWDYFRFSRESWNGLFNKHTGFKVLDARRGEAVSVISNYNIGGPYEEMEHSPGYAMSVCLSEKVSEALVAWEARVADVQKVEYNY